MIADEFSYTQEPITSIPKGTTISYVLKTIGNSSVYFKLALNNPQLIKPLNENKLTQVLVEQINALLRENGVPISALTQYNELIHQTRGVPDFYFHKVEKGQISEPLFVVESKRLPAPPPQSREKEYVVGDNNSGGIERFKIEKHGKGFSECGMIGFIENESSFYWKIKINEWITDLANTDAIWNNNEILIERENQIEYSYLSSLVYTITSRNMKLHHFWIEVNNY